MLDTILKVGRTEVEITNQPETKSMNTMSARQTRQIIAKSGQRRKQVVTSGRTVIVNAREMRVSFVCTGHAHMRRLDECVMNTDVFMIQTHTKLNAPAMKQTGTDVIVERGPALKPVKSEALKTNTTLAW